VSFDPYAPYGRVVESAMRVVTWNVWGRYGSEWETRHVALEATLAEVGPDVICLVESWRDGESSQPARIAARLGLPYHQFAGDWVQEDWVSGVGLVCRWPMSEPRHRALRSEDGAGAGQVVHVAVDGERGPIQLFAVMLDYPLDASAVRQGQVRQLVQFVQEVASRRDPVIVCGDFNAGPDSDEIRMLTGRAATAGPRMVFYDSWEVAGDGSAGYTWSNRNPLAAVGLYPDRRFDYVFSAWPRRGGVGHPVRCALLGVRPPDQSQISDHYGLLADLRY
jgi:endonuclease/exonuclease/phosphatase family metal-dependent hydrolase